MRAQLTKDAVDRALTARGLPASSEIEAISQVEEVEEERGATVPAPPAPSEAGPADDDDASGNKGAETSSSPVPAAGTGGEVSVGEQAPGGRGDGVGEKNVSSCSMPEGPMWRLFEHVGSNATEAGSGLCVRREDVFDYLCVCERASIQMYLYHAWSRLCLLSSGISVFP